MRVAKWVGVLGMALLVAVLVPAAHATSITFTTVAGSDGDGAIAGTVQFIPLTGRIEIVVTNTETANMAKGQAISGFSFSVTGVGIPTAFTELSGVQATLTGASSWTLSSGTAFDNTGSGPAIDHWGFAPSGSTVGIATAGSSVSGATGNPHYMILPSSGTTQGGSSLDNGNFDPNIIGPGTFFLTDAGVTTSTDLTNDISGVTVSFGTGPDKTLLTTPKTVLTTVPEPGTISMLGLGVVGLLGLSLLVRKQALG